MFNPIPLLAVTTSYVLDIAIDQGIKELENTLLPYATPYTGAALLALGAGYTLYRNRPTRLPVAKNRAPTSVEEITKKKTNDKSNGQAQKAKITQVAQNALATLEPRYKLRPRKKPN